MPTDLLLRDAQELWNKGRFYQAIVLLGEDQSQREALPPIDAAILTEIRSAATLEAAWLDHLLTGNENYDGYEVLLILMKRQNLATVAAVLRRFDLFLGLPLDEIDYAIRNRFAARKMAPASRRIYHALYLTRGQEK